MQNFKRPNIKPMPQRRKEKVEELTPQERYDHYRNKFLDNRRQEALIRDGSIRATAANSDIARATRQRQVGKKLAKAKQDAIKAANAPPAAPGTDAQIKPRGNPERPSKRRRKGRAALRIDSQTGGVGNDGAGKGVNVPQK